MFCQGKGTNRNERSGSGETAQLVKRLALQYPWKTQVWQFTPVNWEVPGRQGQVDPGTHRQTWSAGWVPHMLSQKTRWWATQPLACRLPLHTCTQSERDRLLSLWYFRSMVDLVTPNSYILSSAFSSWSFYFLVQSHVSYFSPCAEVAWWPLARRELVDFQAQSHGLRCLSLRSHPRNILRK